MTDIHDAVVIGAGFAGTVAARDLSTAGYSVVHLEARDRIGGRTYTGEAFGRQVEFGGAYAHWTQPNIWRELERYGIGLGTPMEADRAYWLADGAVHSGTATEHAETVAPLIARYTADARERFPQPFDLTAADADGIDQLTAADRIDAADLSGHDRDVLEGLLSSLGHSFDEQGLAQFLFWTATCFGDWSAFMETAGHWPIEGGTAPLLGAIAADSGADLRLSTPVRAVEDDGSCVTVTTRAGDTVRARHAVLALPLNALGDVAMSPAPAPAVRALVERGHPMRTSKVWVRVKGEVEPFSAHAPAGKHPINAAKTEYRHDGDTLLVCFCADASAIDGRDREAVQEALRRFVPDIEVVDTAVHDWAADEFSQGTWAHHRPGDLTGAVPLMREPHGRIHFAGGDIAALNVGSIDGAVASGAGAARNIARALS